MNKQALIFLGTVLLIIGAVVFLLGFFGIRALDAHAQWYLPRFYGHQRNPSITYDDLFAYASNLTKQRGQAELRFYYTLATSCVVLGGVLIAWACDRRHCSSSSLKNDTTRAVEQVAPGQPPPADSLK